MELIKYLVEFSQYIMNKYINIILSIYIMPGGFPPIHIKDIENKELSTKKHKKELSTKEQKKEHKKELSTKELSKKARHFAPTKNVDIKHILNNNILNKNKLNKMIDTRDNKIEIIDTL